MLPRIRRVLTEWLAAGACGIGQIEIRQSGSGFILSHRDDADCEDLKIHHSPNDALELAKFDDYGHYRPLKTAPNLRHGWRLELADLAELQEALDLFYPGRLARAGGLGREPPHDHAAAGDARSPDRNLSRRGKNIR